MVLRHPRPGPRAMSLGHRNRHPQQGPRRAGRHRRWRSTTAPASLFSARRVSSAPPPMKPDRGRGGRTGSCATRAGPGPHPTGRACPREPFPDRRRPAGGAGGHRTRGPKVRSRPASSLGGVAGRPKSSTSSTTAASARYGVRIADHCSVSPPTHRSACRHTGGAPRWSTT